MILHGFNLVAKNPPFTPASLGFADDAAAFLASEGFSTMRLGMVYQAIEPQPIVHDDGCIETVLDTARDLGRHGIFTLLDFHQDDYGSVFGAEGFPAWATLTDGLPNPNLGVGGDYTANPALERAFDNL